MDVVRKLEGVGSSDGTPTKPVTITDCGVLPDDAAVDSIAHANKLLALDAATA